VLAVCLYTIKKVPESPVKIVKIDKEVMLMHDTLRQIRLKYKTLHDTQTIINEKFDTIILLMNGTGIFRTLEESSTYLQKLKSLLNPNGQILIDSSDIIYMFDEDDDGTKWIPTKGYYGELTFNINYKGETEEPFPWLYMDYKTLQNAALENGLRCELILNGKHFDYLARLTQ
jgi:hypothetical protein